MLKGLVHTCLHGYASPFSDVMKSYRATLLGKHMVVGIVFHKRIL